MIHPNSFLKKSCAACLALLLAAPAGAVGPALTQIGVAGAVRGKVMAFPPAAVPAKTVVGREVASGKPLFLNEKVTTDAQGHMQIMLKDETTFTLGPNASMVLDEFVYDPASGAGEVTASVTKGAFRFVTGKIGAKDPSKMKVKFPTGTMGIRGTIVAGMVNDDGSATVVLLGPGIDNNAGERPGAFNLSNEAGSADVTQPGFGSTLTTEDAPPTPPALVPSEQLGAIMGALEAPPEQADSGEGGGSGGSTASSGDSSGDSKSESSGESSGGSGEKASGEGGDTAAGGDSASGDPAGADAAAGGDSTGGDASAGGGDISSLSGQGTMSGGDFAADFGSVAGLTDTSNSITQTAAADSGDAAVGNGVADGYAMWDDVRTVSGGYGYYGGAGLFALTDCNGAVCGSPIGIFTYLLKLDFGMQTYSAASYVWAKDDPSQLEFEDYAAVLGVDYSGLAGSAAFQIVSGSGYFLTDFILKNANGQAATGVDVSSVYSYPTGLIVGGLEVMGSGPSSFTYGTGSAFTEALGTLSDTAWESVRSVPSGVGVYAGAGYLQLTQCQGLPCANPDGVFAYLLRIDFGAQTYGGGESGGAILAQDQGTATSVQTGYLIPETSYAGGSGTPLIATADGNNFFRMDFTLKDVGGVAGAGLEVAASFNDGSTIGSGSSSATLYPSDGFTSLWSGVRTIASGAGMYNGQGDFFITNCGWTACVSPTGTFGYAVYVDFGARTFGGFGSVATVTAEDLGTGTKFNDAVAITQTSFAALNGKAELGLYNDWTFTSDTGNFGVDFSLVDVGGQSAEKLVASAYYDDGSGTEGYGWLGVLDQDVSDWASLAALSGTGWYTGMAPFIMSWCNGVDCVNSEGGFHYGLYVDFGAGTYGGSGSGGGFYAAASGQSFYDSLAIPQTNFPGSGLSKFSASSVSGFLTMDFTLKDVGSVPGGGLGVKAAYSNAGFIGYGFDNVGPGSLPAFVTGSSAWSDIQAVVTGKGAYGGWGFFNLTYCGSGPCGNPGGTFSYFLELDFGAQTYRVQSYLTARDAPTGTSVNASIVTPVTPYDTLSGAAQVTAQSGSGFYSLDFGLSNIGNVAGAGVGVTASYFYDGDGTYTGSGTGQSVMSGLWPASWDAAGAVPSGVGMYAGRGGFLLTLCGGSPCTVSQSVGYFDYVLMVDFGQNKYGGANSGAVVWAYDQGTATGVRSSLNIPETAFGSGSGNATVSASNGSFTVDLTLKDLDGVPGAAMDAKAMYSNGGTTGIGFGFDEFRAATEPSMLPVSGAGSFTGSGTFHLWQCAGGCTSASPVGQFGYMLHVDFGAGQYGGGGSGAWLSTSDLGAGVMIKDSIIIPGGNNLPAGPGAVLLPTLTSASGDFSIDFTLGGTDASSIFAIAHFDDTVNKGVGVSQTTRDNISDWASVRGLSGRGWYVGSGLPMYFSTCNGGCISPNGYFDYGIMVDFGDQVLGGSGSSLHVYLENNAVPVINVTPALAPVVFTALNGSASVSLYVNSGLSVDFTLKDVTSVAALSADIGVNYDLNGNVAHGHDAVAMTPITTATWDDILANVPSGWARYQALSRPFILASCELGVGGACAGDLGPDTWDFTLDVDYTNKTYSLGANLALADSNIPSGGLTRTISVPSADFSSLTGSAVASGSDTGFGVDVTLKNLGTGVSGIPAFADGAASFDSGTGTAGMGDAKMVNVQIGPF